MCRIPRWANEAAVAAVLVLSLPACTKPRDLATPETLYERDVSQGIHNITPVRGERGPLRLHRDGDAYECSTCHDEFEGDLGEEALEGEHADISFDHGRNLFCLNCHDRANSDAYVDHDGSEIPGDQPTRLCAKCHGPHFREWEHDVHGRVNFFWDKQFGEQKKLDCIQCHDPHRPKFQPMKPERPPTLSRFERGPEGEDGDAG